MKTTKLLVQRKSIPVGILRMLILLLFAAFIFSCQEEINPVKESIEDKEQMADLKSAAITAEEIDALIVKIEGYVASGLLEPGIANSLISKLQNAKKSLGKGNNKAVQNQVESVINQLTALVGSGTIDDGLGEDLLDDAIDIPEEESGCGGDFTDPRDGRVYKTVKIGTQCWMAENLAYLPEVSLSSQGSETVPYYYVWGYEGIDITEARQHVNYLTYGVLYNWPAAMAGLASSSSNPSGVQGICPGGWHLPSDDEWEQLAQYVSEQMGPYEKSGYNWEGVGHHLKATSGWYYATGGWYYEDNGTDDFGFSALPGGYRSGKVGGFYGLGTNAFWWCSTENDSSTAWYRYLGFQSYQLLKYYNFRAAGASVRCIKDN